MGLAIDGTANSFSLSSLTSWTYTLSTSNSNDMIYLAQAYNAGNPILSVTSANLTFALRSTTSQSSGIETWWALATNPLASEVITVTMTGTATYNGGAVFGVSGADTVAKWDPHAGIPVMATSGEPTISTTNNNNFIISASRFSTSGPRPGWGWTLISSLATQYFIAQYQISQVPVTSLATLASVGSGLENGVIMDAITQSGPGNVLGWTKT